MYKSTISGQSFEVTVNGEGYSLNGNPVDLDIITLENDRFHILRNSHSYLVEVLKKDQQYITLRINGTEIEVNVKNKLDQLLERLGMDQVSDDALNDITAPMPGLILEVNVTEGDEVEKGDPIMILEAMKMENVIKAPGQGVVKAVKVGKGDSVEKNQVLVQF